jgi:hypothetical protein
LVKRNVGSMRGDEVKIEVKDPELEPLDDKLEREEIERDMADLTKDWLAEQNKKFEQDQ